MISLVFCGCAAPKKEEPLIKDKVNRLFGRFLEEDFIETDEIAPSSGWVMALPSGEKVPRSFLQRQAGPVIECGPEAVPHLFPWARSDQLYIRYIALYSLEQITGKKPHVSYFATDPQNSQLEQAIETWRKWWENQREK